MKRRSLLALLGIVVLLSFWGVLGGDTRSVPLAGPPQGDTTREVDPTGAHVQEPSRSGPVTRRAGVSTAREHGDSPSPPRAEGGHSATILIHVRRIDDGEVSAGVEAVRVWIEPTERGAPEPVYLGETDVYGDVAGELPPLGKCRVAIEPDSVPRDLQVPGEFETAGPFVAGVTAQHFELGAGDRTEVTIGLPEARGIRGRVSGPSGSPVARALVEALALRAGLDSVRYLARSGEHGAFEFPSVLPLEYSIRINTIEDADDSLEGCVLPPPLTVDARREPVRDIELEVRRGELTVYGRVEDESGEPFTGLGVLAYYYVPQARLGNGMAKPRRYTMNDRIGAVVTDSGGRFRFNGLHQHPFKVQIGAAAAANGGRKERRLSRGIEVIEVDPTGADYFDGDLGVVRATRSHT